MTAMNPEASRQAVVEAALVLLERMGLTLADLTAAFVACIAAVTPCCRSCGWVLVTCREAAA